MIKKYLINSRSQKENLKMAEAAEEQRLLRVQKNYIELEMRKFKRKKMCSLHDLENQLLRDVKFLTA
jgi:thousand and one amino acid protein kinase